MFHSLLVLFNERMVSLGQSLGVKFIGHLPLCWSLIHLYSVPTFQPQSASANKSRKNNCFIAFNEGRSGYFKLKIMYLMTHLLV